MLPSLKFEFIRLQGEMIEYRPVSNNILGRGGLQQWA